MVALSAGAQATVVFLSPFLPLFAVSLPAMAGDAVKSAAASMALMRTESAAVIRRAGWDVCMESYPPSRVGCGSADRC